ncbi:MAG: DUF362 domain-containing protein [bacterium]
MKRRDFLRKSIAAGAASVAGAAFLPKIAISKSGSVIPGITPDLAVVTGTDYFNNTVKAVNALGGMKNFVSRNAKVGLLINSPWKNPGTYTNPDIALAVVEMCFKAGTKEIYSIEDAAGSYWKRSSLVEKFKDEVASIKPSGGKNAKIEIPEGKKLKKADVSRALLECDVVIDIPVCKDHSGTRFSCNLKNMMGACPHSTNRFFHLGSGAEGFYDDIDHLSQCIADLNLVRQPDLCIADATEFVVTNGPAGPGEIKKAQKIVAGSNPVSVDSYCAELRGLESSKVQMITMAHEHGLGKMDISSMTIKKIGV